MPSRLATVTAIISLLRNNLHAGNNRLDIVVSGQAGRNPNLGKLYIGPEDSVIGQFNRLRFVAEVLPTLIVGGQAALALIFVTIWNRRRQETPFGWFALDVSLDTLRGSSIIPALGIESSSVSYWSLLVPFSSVAYLMFASALVGLPTKKRIWLAWAGPTLITAAAAVSSPAFATGILMPIGITAVYANLLGAAGLFANGCRCSRARAFRPLLCQLKLGV